MVADDFDRVDSRYARPVSLAATVVIVLVAVAHVWFAILEMVLWTKPIGIKTFGRSKQVMLDSASLAQNQGLYNLFLVAGLAWSLVFKAAVITGSRNASEMAQPLHVCSQF